MTEPNLEKSARGGVLAKANSTEKPRDFLDYLED